MIRIMRYELQSLRTKTTARPTVHSKTTFIHDAVLARYEICSSRTRQQIVWSYIEELDFSLQSPNFISDNWSQSCPKPKTTPVQVTSNKLTSASRHTTVARNSSQRKHNEHVVWSIRRLPFIYLLSTTHMTDPYFSGFDSHERYDLFKISSPKGRRCFEL